MCTRRCQKKFASAPSFKHGTRNALGHSPYETQETLCDNANGICKQTPGQREQRFCSSSQVIRNGFYILPPGIYNILHYHEKVGLRPPTRDCESNDCPGSPVPVCMQLAYIRRGSLSPMTTNLLSPTTRSALAQGGRRSFPVSSGGGE